MLSDSDDIQSIINSSDSTIPYECTEIYKRRSPRLLRKEIQKNGIYHENRIIFKYRGESFYVSSGQNSGCNGMVFPFHGIYVKGNLKKGIVPGWFRKPSYGNIRWTLQLLFKTLNKKNQAEWNRTTWYKRFGNYKQIYTSYKFGHDFWEDELGVIIAKYLDFDETLYKSEEFPTKIIEVSCGKGVNKWLKNNYL